MSTAYRPDAPGTAAHHTHPTAGTNNQPGDDMAKTCTDNDGTFHTDDTTIWFRLAYGLPFRLWKVIPHRWMTLPCPRWGKQ